VSETSRPDSENYAFANRIDKIFRLRDILAEIGVTTREQLDDFSAADWLALCKVDLERRKAKTGTTTPLRPPSDKTIAGVIASFEPLEELS